MPQIRSALMAMQDAHAATKRGIEAWNPSQLRDAIESARRFIALAADRLDDESGS